MRALKILIVDDDEDFAGALKEFLEIDGHQAKIAGDGKAALAALEAGSFDAVLVDFGLPDMDGTDCVAAIRAHQPNLPCFLLTGHDADEVAGRDSAGVAVEILTKPVHPSTLTRRLAEL